MGPSQAFSTAEKLRKAGNSYFKKGRFNAAIEAYTEVFCSSIRFSMCSVYIRNVYWVFIIDDFLFVVDGFQGDNSVS